MDEMGPFLTYRYFDKEVTVPFAFGLSYTNFSYSNLSLSSTSIAPCDPIVASVTVHNVGKRDSDEVVQLYVEQQQQANAVPLLRLANFTRIHLKSGAMHRVHLTVLPKWHTTIMEQEDDFWNPNIVVEGGQLRISVGGTSGAASRALHADVTVTDDADLEDCVMMII